MSLVDIVSSFVRSQGEVKSPQLRFRVLSFDVLHLGGWRGGMDVLRGEIGKICGLKIVDGGGVVSDKDYILLPLNFDKYRLLSKPSNLPRGLLSLDSGVGVSVDQSHSFCHLGISGDGVREFLRLLFLVDFGEGHFGDGDFLVCGYHHVGIGVHCLGGEFVLHLPSGVAESLCESILEVGLDFGIKSGT